MMIRQSITGLHRMMRGSARSKIAVLTVYHTPVTYRSLEDRSRRDFAALASTNHRGSYSSDGSNFYRVALMLTTATMWSLWVTHNSVVTYNESATSTDVKELPIFRQEEVAKHTTKEKGVWVIYNDGVYDITSFIANHPGGQDKIMLAAGGDIGPFWNLYRQHFNSSLPMDLLQAMQIGRLHEEDFKAMQAARDPADSNDPYSRDPTLSPVMKYLSKKPINAEAPQFLQTDSWITPKELWFVRNHHPVCEQDADTAHASSVALEWCIKGSSEKHHNLSFSIDELRTKFKQHSVVSTLQCGGNRRAEMNKIAKTNGSPWCTAISTAKWTGVRLRDLLLAAGVDEDAIFESSEGNDSKKVNHVIFVGQDEMQASIPIDKALGRHGDVLIAYEMNDEPIPPQHGFPLRAVVPGHVGVRNVKWLKSIQLSDEEATGPWQRGMSYKGFGPSTKSLEGIDVERIPSLQEQPVQSAITSPRPSLDAPTPITAGEPLTVQGYSYSGGGRGIVRVDVSIDGGKNWRTATLTEGSEQPLDRAWAWTFWECDFDIPDGSDAIGQKLEIICKATDASYNVQPDSIEGIWNLRGINNNAWHRVSAIIIEDDEEG